ncbi:uncharacterized protein LOC133720798 isoform X1 [Rosa rugosa]|uniref:uncharacterized protein LOC133720798 isoform X1 n=2 Tax=Rosa rugosa TaxID=74645 RepID=UPI002B40AAFA|nr:uncharacterized protein LOC133720798 isoform X1 [Rosa rugosa]
MALHGSSFCLNGNLSFKEFNSLPCACYSSGMLHHLSLPSRKYNLVVANTLERGHRFQFLPGDGRLKLRTEQSTSSLPTSGLRSLKPSSAKCDDSKDSSVSENIILDAETLTRDLDIAIAEENYAKAAEIRDRLRLLREDSMTSVLAANSRFYESFRIGDLAAMQSLWAKRDEVCCVHPGARGIYGYEDVMTSWDYVWANYEFPLQIELKDVNANVRGDMGFVSCVELVKTKGSSWGGQFVTNVFERIDGQWFISVHHASPIDL